MISVLSSINKVYNYYIPQTFFQLYVKHHQKPELQRSFMIVIVHQKFRKIVSCLAEFAFLCANSENENSLALVNVHVLEF